MDATCHSDATFCNTYLTDLAKEFIAPENCGADYDAGYSLVRNAYTSMVSYAPVYTAGCLKDPDTSMYCFASAVTNLSNPSQMYVYYLPLNESLPGSTVPSCSPCLQQTMNIFHAATANRKQPIAYTYPSAARQINTICGPTFVNETLPSVLSNMGSTGGPAVWAVLTIPLLAVFPLLL